MNCPEMLYVEDNPSDVLLLKSALKLRGNVIHLHVVQDGNEALAFLRRQAPFENVRTPELVLLDLNTPKKNGFEVLREARQDPDLRTIPMVVFSGSSNAKDRDKCMKMGASDFWNKPRDFHEFATIIEKIKTFLPVEVG
jgi:CheY-like chemotaxis protein